VLTVIDLVIALLLPLTIGVLAVLVGKGLKQTSVNRSLGMLAALLVGYFCRYSMTNFAYANDDRLSFTERFANSISQAATDLLCPTTAIAWVPMLSGVALAVTVGLASLSLPALPNQNSEQGDSPVDSQLGAIPWSRFVLCIAIVTTVSCVAMVRLLWSSVYLSVDSPFFEKAAYVFGPAVVIGGVWAGAFAGRENLRFSTFAHASGILLLSVSGAVLMGSSGSFSFALLQVPVVAAVMVGMIFRPQKNASPAISGDAWLIVGAICLPVVLGHLFSQVTLFHAALHLLSAASLVWVPLGGKPFWTRVGIVCAVCLPAIAAAVLSAAAFANAIDSPYRG
jgi:hypothetical protein